MGLADFLSVILTLAIVLLGLMMGIYNQAGIGIISSPPAYNYTATDALNMTTEQGLTSDPAQTGTQQSNQFSLWKMLGGIYDELFKFPEFCARLGVPSIISVPAWALIWTVLGWDAIQIKKYIWG